MIDPRENLLSLLAAWEPAPGAAAPEPASAARLLALAESLLGDAADTAPGELWRRFLDLTRHPDFLESLPDAAHRERWAEACFGAVRACGYTLETMLDQRVSAHPGRTLFLEPERGEAGRWTYAQVRRKARAYAAALIEAAPEGPRVALLAENSARGACVDLGCLAHGLPIYPLNPRLPLESAAWICGRLGINVLVTGGAEARAVAAELRGRDDAPWVHFVLEDEPSGDGGISLEEACARIDPVASAERLAAWPRPGLDDAATALFTSGSTGQPKGVAFSMFNMVAKRFARAAALPSVGRDETLLCYLPLFHTFGRFLEMQGAIFWGGTYAFVGNPSRESLLARLREVRPTILISIPLRWRQIHDACHEEIEGEPPPTRVREVVGGRLRWGLSAAGYLDPRVFRFFQRHGVALCSGFGMTEATGGVTMTPPGEYRDDSVGLPLPGARTRLSPEGELQIAGPYVARYLDDPPPAPGEERWFPTGDVFRRHDDGHLEIVDRLKDIYKNSRGQTVAPQRVEQKFRDVPGIARVFLVGDHRDYNVLLIVPDPRDPVLGEALGEDQMREYFHRIVAAANRDLPGSERVVNFAVLDRDFSREEGELTEKGSYRRKTIEANFSAVIEDLYRSDWVRIATGGVDLRIPRWFFRDLGILETDVVAAPGGILERQRGLTLRVAAADEPGRARVGDLEYEVGEGPVDLGVLARQPLLWGANPGLVAFCPVKDGWDTELGGFSPHVYLPWREDGAAPPEQYEAKLPPLSDRRLSRLHRLSTRALFETGDASRRAVADLGAALSLADSRTADLIRRRLDALARHPDEEVRCDAYRILLLDEPVPDYSQILPRFLESGLPFLNERSIEQIAKGGLEKHRLEAFRRRLDSYRRQLEWPAAPRTRDQFGNIFKLLSDFARYRPAYYGAVREELATWALHDDDPDVARLAEDRMTDLAAWYEAKLDAEAGGPGAPEWRGKVVYQEGLTGEEIARLEKVLVGTSFLPQSLLLAADGAVLDMDAVPVGGIWISRVAVRRRQHHYRLSLNTKEGHHFDLLLVLWRDPGSANARENVLHTVYWQVALSGYPYGLPALPRVGSYRPDLGALSLTFVDDLTVWEKVREFASTRGGVPGDAPPPDWRRLFVRGLATYFTAWRNSGRRIVPGLVTPRNVAVPESDFREGCRILSLTGWQPYTNTLSLVAPMLRNFFRQTLTHYPWTAALLDPAWICEACVEALDGPEADDFLARLETELAAAELPWAVDDFRERVAACRRRLVESPRAGIALDGAVARFLEWAKANPGASPLAREQVVEELFRLYALDRQPFLTRFLLFRKTLFTDAPPAVGDAFDRLLDALFHSPGQPATNMIELSDLQEVLTSPADREIFARMVFPHSAMARHPELLYVGEKENRQLIVASYIQDKHAAVYTVREPLEPSEYGQLYRLFFKSGYYRTISERDRFYIVLDAGERIVGGICWHEVDPGVAHLNGIVVATPLLGRGISSALIEDFCARMANLGYGVVKTLFVLRPFFERHGFRLDPRWGGLVRRLTEPSSALPIESGDEPE